MSRNNLRAAEEVQLRGLDEGARGFIAVPECDADWFRGALPPEVAVSTLSPLPSAETQSGQVLELRPRSAPFFGAASVSEEGRKLLEAQNSSIAQNFGQPLVEPLMLDGQSEAPTKLMRWLSQAFAKLAHSAHVDAAQQRMALAALRRDYVEMETSFKGLEDYIVSQHLPPMWSAFELAAGKGWISYGGPPRDDIVIEQPLPVSARGIAAIELHVAFLHAHATGQLEVALHANDDPEPGHVWTVDYAALRNGWNLFQFTDANTMPNVTVRLVVKLHTKTGSAPSISVGEIMVPEKFRPRGPLGLWSTSALAVQVWKGVPGVRIPRFHNAIAAKEAAQQFGQVLSPNQMRTAALLFAPMPEKTEGINYWQKEAAILVHPRADGLTCAVIKGVDVQDLVAIRAVVNLANEKAQPVEFAVTAIKADTFNPSAVNELFAQWTAVKPLSWSEVFDPLGETIGGPVDILLATRMERNKKPDQAWALFRRIELIRASDTIVRPALVAVTEDAVGA
jgi:hypothetical protein